MFLDLLIYGLFSDTVSNFEYVVSNNRMINESFNCKVCGRKKSWPNSRYTPGIWLQGLIETMKNLKSGQLACG
jgi:hypothetical protein